MATIKIKKTSKDIFCQAVEEKVQEENLTYLEALAEIIEECDADAEVVAKLLNNNLKEKIFLEAVKANLLKDENKGTTTTVDFIFDS